MKAPSLPQIGFALLIGADALLLLHALGGPAPPPHSLSLPELLRLALALPLVLLLPGLLMAPAIFGRDVFARGSDERLDATWLLLAAVPLNILLHFLHFNLLRGFAIPIRWPALLLLMVIEGAIAQLVLLRRTKTLRLAVPSPALIAGLLVALLIGGVAAVRAAPWLLRDASWFFSRQVLGENWEGDPNRGAVEVDLSAVPGWRRGLILRPDRLDLPLTLINHADHPVDSQIFLLLHGPVGGGGELRRADAQPVVGRILQRAEVEGVPDLVERYVRWGTTVLKAPVRLNAHERADFWLHIDPEHRHVRDLASLYAVLDLSCLAPWEVAVAASSFGMRPLPPFQLLNIAENIRWTEEIAGEFALPGRPVKGPVALAQPPAWSYLLAPLRELGAKQSLAASSLLLFILLGVVLASLHAIEELSPDRRPDPLSFALFGGTLGFGALQHGRLMIEDGSMNFPDNLFALALLLVVVLLCTARTRMFVAWALLAALLRYPGAVVVGLAVAVLWRVDPARGRGSVEGLARYVLGLGAFCAVMLIVGLLSGQLQPWLWSLYFETVPEHFRNNADALPLLQRPLHFVQLAFFFGCGIFVVGLPPRGTLAKVAAGTALLYMPFLAFIDHFSRHYFLPLIALFGLAASASIAQIPDLRWRRSTAAVALLVAASLLALWRG